MMKKTVILHSFLIAVCTVLLFGSCSVKRKNSSTYSSGTLDRTKAKKSNKNAPMTDASSGRNIDFSGNKLDNYANLLGVSTREVNKSKDLYLMIDDWMGTPHRMGGLDRKGVDCSAFVGLVYREVFGKDLPRTSRDMADHVKRKYERQLKEGDLIFFSFGGRQIDHVGIYLHNGKFVHVSTRRGVIISDMKDAWYYKYFKRAGSPKG